jgi:uncharacterized membrane protein YebE (DUF533 family)
MSAWMRFSRYMDLGALRYATNAIRAGTGAANRSTRWRLTENLGRRMSLWGQGYSGRAAGSIMAGRASPFAPNYLRGAARVGGLMGAGYLGYRAMSNPYVGNTAWGIAGGIGAFSYLGRRR